MQFSNGLYEGQMATTKDALIANFERYGIKVPKIHEGWFDETLPNGLPGEIAFAHLDGDFYDSILTSMVHVYPKLSQGAVCVIDDYCDPEILQTWNDLPGVKRACDEFLTGKPEEVSVLYAGSGAHGYFRKL